MSKPPLSKYEFSFPVAGQASPCYFDVRCLMCKGVPKIYDASLVKPDIKEHIDSLLNYISERSDPAKRNMYNHFRQHFLWLESENKPAFTQDSIVAFNKAAQPIRRKRVVNRFYRSIGMIPPPVSESSGAIKDRLGRPIVKVNLQIPEPKSFRTNKGKESFIFSLDGKHIINVSSRSRGIVPVDLEPQIQNMTDKHIFLASLREMFERDSGDTFIAKLSKIKEYITFSSEAFFCQETLRQYVESLHHAVLRKDKGASQGRRKANVVVELFDYAEISIENEVRKNIARLPNPKSKPVNAYESEHYISLIKMLLKIQRATYQRLTERDYFGELLPGDTDFKCLGFADLMSTFMTSSYYLIARYSAWTDSTLKNISTDSIEFDKQDGEWVHLKGFKPRGGYKNLETTLFNGFNDGEAIRKSGYRLLVDIIRVSESFGIKHDKLFYTVKSDGEVRSFRPQPRLKQFILQQLPMLKTINSQRFRETEIAIAHNRSFQHAVNRSGSTSAVVKRHYSDGLPGETNRQLNNTVNAIYDVANAGQKKKSAQEIKRKLYDIHPIPIVTDKTSNTPMGTRCQAGSAGTLSKFHKRAEKHGFGSLSCADLTSCFGCRHAAIIDSVDDIWNLISFKNQLINGRIFSVDADHHDDNFGEVMANIDAAISKCSTLNVESANQKYNNEGPHPFWAGEEFL